MRTNLLLVAALATFTFAGSVLAQNTGGGNGPGTAQGDQTRQRDQDKVQDCTTADMERDQSRLRQQLPADVNAAVREMKQAREKYTAQKRELKKALAGCTDAERQQLRDQLREIAKEQARDREQLRDRLQELRESVPTHRELMEQARERAGERARRGE